MVNQEQLLIKEFQLITNSFNKLRDKILTVYKKDIQGHLKEYFQLSTIYSLQDVTQLPEHKYNDFIYDVLTYNFTGYELTIEKNCLDVLKIFEYIIFKYSESHRTYHNLNHIFNCIDEYENNIKNIPHSELSRYEKQMIKLSLLFHDIVYNLKSPNNEQDSSNIFSYLMMFYLDSKISKETTHYVSDAILTTKTHSDPKYNFTKYVLDIDLSILGKSWDVYNKYRLNIYKEYSPPDTDINNLPSVLKDKRVGFLKSFLKREKIYFTTHYIETHEKNARNNIQKEIEELSK